MSTTFDSTPDLQPDRAATAGTVAVALTAGPLIFLVAEAVTARAWTQPRYSYLRNWISDLGVPDPGTFQGRPIDSPLHVVMNTGFVLSGVALLVGVSVLARTLTGKTRPAAVALAVIAATGYTLVGTMHTSSAAVANGTIVWHFVGAFLAILGGNILGIVLGAHWWRTTTTRALGHFVAPAGALGLVAVLILGFTATTDAPNGLIERISVYTVLLWQLRVALHLISSAGRRSGFQA